MLIFPAVDLVDGKAVRLFKGDYAQMTIYSDSPVNVAKFFREAGAEYLHVVDLEGARDGGTPNRDTVCRLIAESGLKVEIGGGIRTAETVAQYLDAGAFRVILGTAALTQPGFVGEMAARYGEHIAVGADLRDGLVAIRGWTETSAVTGMDFCLQMQSLGVRTVICTDISKDGVLGGTNRGLYADLSNALDMDIVASGGVTTLEDIRALREMGLYGAILGKALYAGELDLAAAIREASAV
ncbi:MAG: 1-(5-phosphoribosyl)-5-[(5-phosphoribosylamino)methylideneamino]imidazole-4-carboxamide isomerase [Eubacteriales bacterium]|nr:1-(5-phosphoribosyl)-5-[(5-phosphoribosylamino)methylideneamino]imidazole-4-carboxamide isomerase [Eubacteriales bacterium]